MNTKLFIALTLTFGGTILFSSIYIGLDRPLPDYHCNITEVIYDSTTKDNKDIIFIRFTILEEKNEKIDYLARIISNPNSYYQNKYFVGNVVYGWKDDINDYGFVFNNRVTFKYQFVVFSLILSMICLSILLCRVIQWIGN